MGQNPCHMGLDEVKTVIAAKDVVKAWEKSCPRRGSSRPLCAMGIFQKVMERGEERRGDRRGRHAQIDEDRCRLQTLEKEVALLPRRPSTVVESALTDGMEEKRAERGRGGRASDKTSIN